MNLKRLTQQAKLEVVKKILKGIEGHLDNNPDFVDSDFIELLVELVDDASADDTFGTEGWKHNFGIED